MNILMICTNDPAGMGIAFTKAINRHTEHTCRLITTKTKYNFEYEKDIHVSEPWLVARDSSLVEELEGVLRDADVFHFHTFADEETPIGPFTAKDFIQGKRVVYHQHGEPLRSNPDHYRDLYAKKNARVFVSTPDLLDFLPDATWIPNLVPIDEPPYRPDEQRATSNEQRVVIGQSPTRTEIKDTDTLLRVYRCLKGRYNGFLGLDVIQNVPHAECLERKRRCRIFFDHMQGYFGVSSLEALSHGTPTVAHLSEWTRTHVEEFAGTRNLPWVAARDSAELESALSLLVRDKEQREEVGRESRSFMESAWHPSRVMSRLLGEYGKAWGA